MGAGVEATLTIERVDVRRYLMDATPITPQTTTGIVEWSGLSPSQAYILVASFTGDGTIVIENDGISPTQTESVVIDNLSMRVAVLITPRAHTIRLTFPPTVVLAAASLSHYAGGNPGNEV
jgi:hypothetical protein